MNSLLRTEWLKIKSYRPFWVVFWLYPVCLGGIVAIGLWGQMKIQGLAQGSSAAGTVAANLPLAFPYAWQTVAYIASWLHFIPALLLILNVTNEFNFRSHRQNLLEGWSRAQFVLAKLLLALGIGLYCTINTLIFTVLAGLFSRTAPSLEGSAFLGLFFLQGVVYAVFALLVGFLVRRAALALGAFLMYSMILENIVSFLINLRFAGWGNYLPLEVAKGLVPVPFFDEKAPQAAKDFMALPSQQLLLVAAAVYLALFVGFMWMRFHREDLVGS